MNFTQTLLLVATLVFLSGCNAFYFPGVAPRDYAKGELIDVKVNSLDSTKTLLPIEYYNTPFCKPSVKAKDSENLGEYLTGDRIESSPYQFETFKTEQCKILCRKTLSQVERKKLKKLIRQDYHMNLIVDNLPAFTVVPYTVNGRFQKQYQAGFPVGFIGDGLVGAQGHVHLLNHLNFKVQVHVSEDESYRVVGFEVQPTSIQHTYEGKWNGVETRLETCLSPNRSQFMDLSVPHKHGETSEVVFTYAVKWERSDIKWASRWDIYLKMNNPKIHWFSIVNSLVIVMFLSGMVAMILLRTVYQDLARYNQIDQSLETQVEETGWKLLHGDVFRTPSHPKLLSVLVGTGTQVSGMAVITLFGAVLGFLSPANRGALMSAVLLLFVLMGYLAGYMANRIHGMFGLDNWRANAVHTAIYFPAMNFGIFFFFNLLLWANGSSGAVPFFELFAILVLWFGISVPLVYLGSFVSNSRPVWESPVRVNAIPRMIPEQPWYMQPVPSILIGGVLPFGSVFIEAVFIFTSIWQHQLYYMFTFLFLVFSILIITCVEISIVMCYLQLCGEDHHWWWRSFLTSGSSAFYLFLYSIMYFATKLDITKFLSGMLYFGYSFLIASFFFVLTGSIGFLATLYFVRRIYSELKID